MLNSTKYYKIVNQTGDVAAKQPLKYTEVI